MAGETLGEVIRRLGRSGGLQGDLAQTDAQLLDRFARRRDEPAFAALLARHGSMVLGLCRRLLHDPRDSEDAFQAAFLILARKAGAIQRQTLLGPWLYGVAWRVAVRLRGRAARRCERERAGMDLDALPADDAAWSDVRRVVQEEVQRLPDVYRSAVILCCLEGKTNEEAARLLRRPVGTVKSRLARARELLRTRLAGRGMTVSVGALGAILAAHSVTASAALVDATIRAALPFAASGVVAGGIASARAVALSQGVLRTMMLKKLTFMAALVLATALMGGGGNLAYRAWAAAPGDVTKVVAAAPKDDATKEKPPADADADKIQGTWVAVSAEMDGKAAPAEAIKDLTLVVSADKVAFNPGGEDRQSTYKLDPTKTPKRIELTPLDGPAKGKMVHCLYELDGDRLKLCLLNGPGEEPKEFATTPGSNLRLLVLERKPAGMDDAAKDKPNPSPADGARSEREQKLLQDWSDTANKAFELRKKYFVNGRTDIEPCIGAAQRLLAAELARSATKADRSAAYQAHLDRVTDIEKIVKAKFEAGKIAEADVADAEYYRIEAEILLEREKAK